MITKCAPHYTSDRLWLTDIETDNHNATISPPPVYLGFYKDPLKLRKIDIWHHANQGVLARVSHFNPSGLVREIQGNLPVVGLPPQLRHESDSQKLLLFFRLTHLIPEKGADGVFNRVSAHISGRGGVKPAIPFQPGLALGSIVKGDVLLQLEKYANEKQKRDNLEEQLQNAEKEKELLETKIYSRKLNLDEKARQMIKSASQGDSADGKKVDKDNQAKLQEKLKEINSIDQELEKLNKLISIGIKYTPNDTLIEKINDLLRRIVNIFNLGQIDQQEKIIKDKNALEKDLTNLLSEIKLPKLDMPDPARLTEEERKKSSKDLQQAQILVDLLKEREAKLKICLDKLISYFNEFLSNNQNIKPKINNFSNKISNLVEWAKTSNDEVKDTKLLVEKGAVDEDILNILLEFEEIIGKIKKSLFDIRVQEKNANNNPMNDKLISAWNKQIVVLEDFIDKTGDELVELISNQEIPMFKNFQQGITSPIDFSASTFDTFPRGFDSLKFQSEYFDMNEETSAILDKLNQTSNSISGSVGASANIGIVKIEGSVGFSRNSAVAHRLSQIKNSGKAEGVLMINAVATTRHVRAFKNLVYDHKRLKQFADLMDPKKVLSEQDLNLYGITVDDKKNKSIFILTEAVLGGSFTALVTFLKEDSKNRRIDNTVNANDTEVSAKLSVSVPVLPIGPTLSGKGGRKNESQDKSDILASVSQTRVKIEFFSEGALPIFNSEKIKHEFLKHIDLNPSNFQLTKEDETQAIEIVNARGNPNNQKALEIALEKRRIKQENAQEAVLNTTKAVNTIQEDQTLHTMDKVMEAYENFAKKMTEDRNCGVPIGFYYEVLTAERIGEMIREFDSQNVIVDQSKNN